MCCNDEVGDLRKVDVSSALYNVPVPVTKEEREVCITSHFLYKKSSTNREQDPRAL